MVDNWYRNRVARDPEFRKKLAERARIWRAKKLAADPEFLTAENCRKRAAERKLKAAGGLPRKQKSLRARLAKNARIRGRRAGIEAMIKTSDIHWPTHCPVLGIELDYLTQKGMRNPNAPNLPSLDRWDNAKGYVPGNVYVISLRANLLKSNATPAELAAIAAYALHGVTVPVR